MNIDTDYVAFTDGLLPDWRKAEAGQPLVGGVLFEAKGRGPEVLLHEARPEAHGHLDSSKAPNLHGGTLCTSTGLEGFKEKLRGRNVLLFVDSEAVEGALVKGYSSSEDT